MESTRKPTKLWACQPNVSDAVKAREPTSWIRGTWFPRHRNFQGRGLYLAHPAHTGSSFCSCHFAVCSTPLPSRWAEPPTCVQQPHGVTLGSHSEHQDTALRGILPPRSPRSLRPQVMYTLPPLERAERHCGKSRGGKGGRSCGGLTGAARSENYNTLSQWQHPHRWMKQKVLREFLDSMTTETSGSHVTNLKCSEDKYSDYEELMKRCTFYHQRIILLFQAAGNISSLRFQPKINMMGSVFSFIFIRVDCFKSPTLFWSRTGLLKKPLRLWLVVFWWGGRSSSSSHWLCL